VQRRLSIVQGTVGVKVHNPSRRLSKRKKDELDLIRLAEAYPQLRDLYPTDLREQIERG